MGNVARQIQRNGNAFWHTHLPESAATTATIQWYTPERNQYRIGKMEKRIRLIFAVLTWCNGNNIEFSFTVDLLIFRKVWNCCTAKVPAVNIIDCIHGYHGTLNVHHTHTQLCFYRKPKANTRPFHYIDFFILRILFEPRFKIKWNSGFN